MNQKTRCFLKLTDVVGRGWTKAFRLFNEMVNGLNKNNYAFGLKIFPTRNTSMTKCPVWFNTVRASILLLIGDDFKFIGKLLSLSSDGYSSRDSHAAAALTRRGLRGRACCLL
jgi:hypothetical protein